MKIKLPQILIPLAILWSIPSLVSAQYNATPAPSFHVEKNGLLIVEMENTSLSGQWKMHSSKSDFTGLGYISWEGEQFFGETGQGELNYPIYINTPGTYKINWRMAVGKGTEVTEHNDTWLKVHATQFYGKKPNRHQILPQPLCALNAIFDCPNGNSSNGFFKVYGQDVDFIWQANTSDNDGHDLFAYFAEAGEYLVTLNARSSFCLLDRMVLSHVDLVEDARAKDIQQPESATIPYRKTKVSIHDNQFYINGELTYKDRFFEGKKIEGLLFNSRMVQGIFDDLNPETKKGFIYPDTKFWDADRNTNEFVAAMKSWREHGLLAFTLNLQGGSPLGYGNEGWVNSTFDEKGNLRPAYMNRLERILNRADELGMVVILGYFYFGQDEHLENEAAVIRAVDNITNWLLEKNYRNILVELNNECDIHYDHKILQADRISELIARVKNTQKNNFRLLVSTSYSGGKLPRPNVVAISDFLLLHGNSVEEPARISEMVNLTKQIKGYHNQPILFNEDDHFDFEAETNNLKSAVEAYASWGYFDYRMKEEGFESGYQSVPVDWGINSERKKSFFKKIKQITGF